MLQSCFSSVPASHKLFALLGDPVIQSKSPAFWNKAFESLNYNAAYVACRVSSADFPEAIKYLVSKKAVGFNVTTPHKIAAAKMCGSLKFPADELMAANCIKILPDGSLEGYNTDAIGLYRIFSRLKGQIANRKALVLGAGGAAKAVVWALRQLSVSVLEIARKFSDKKFGNFEHLNWNRKNFFYGINESDIIINATTLGWNEQDSIQELKDYLNSGKIFVDLNYRLSSDLLISAINKGCLVIDGRELLLEQGVESFNSLVGLEPPRSVMRQVIFD